MLTAPAPQDASQPYAAPAQPMVEPECDPYRASAALPGASANSGRSRTGSLRLLFHHGHVVWSENTNCRAAVAAIQTTAVGCFWPESAACSLGAGRCALHAEHRRTLRGAKRCSGGVYGGGG